MQHSDLIRNMSEWQPISLQTLNNSITINNSNGWSTFTTLKSHFSQEIIKECFDKEIERIKAKDGDMIEAIIQNETIETLRRLYKEITGDELNDN